MFRKFFIVTFYYCIKNAFHWNKIDVNISDSYNKNIW